MLFSSYFWQFAGDDASVAFKAFHNPSVLSMLDKGECVGKLDMDTVPEVKREEKHCIPPHTQKQEVKGREAESPETTRLNKREVLPSISQMINVFDFEQAAREVEDVVCVFFDVFFLIPARSWQLMVLLIIQVVLKMK